jgi:hypothetical protein
VVIETVVESVSGIWTRKGIRCGAEVSKMYSAASRYLESQVLYVSQSSVAD